MKMSEVFYSIFIGAIIFLIAYNGFLLNSTLTFWVTLLCLGIAYEMYQNDFTVVILIYATLITYGLHYNVSAPLLALIYVIVISLYEMIKEKSIIIYSCLIIGAGIAYYFIK
jgi:hypothetical protein